MILSVIIPAHNEEDCIEETVLQLQKTLKTDSIDFEILIINDHSTDSTKKILQQLMNENPEISFIDNHYSNGFGLAVRTGLERFSGNAVAIVMADASDDPKDVVNFFRKLEEGYDCVFGSRFLGGNRTINYPTFKLIMNRFTNLLIRLLFGIRYNDTTNAFKMYRRETIEGLRPFLSHHFNLTVELPLKAITRGFTYAVLPNSYTNRTTGKSKLKLKEMGSRYMFIIIYCLIEKWLSRGDYKKFYNSISEPPATPVITD